MTFEIKPQPGAMMQCRSVGESLAALAKLFTACDKELGENTVLMLERASTGDDGALKFDVLCVRREHNAPAARRRKK